MADRRIEGTVKGPAQRPKQERHGPRSAAYQRRETAKDAKRRKAEEAVRLQVETSGVDVNGSIRILWKREGKIDSRTDALVVAFRFSQKAENQKVGVNVRFNDGSEEYIQFRSILDFRAVSNPDVSSRAMVSDSID